MSSLSLLQSCLWTVTRCVPLVQQKLLTFITTHEFTQPCSILSLNSDTMCAPSAAEISYLYHSTWVHSVLFNLVFEQWRDMCPYCSKHFLPLSLHMSSPSLVQSGLWTVTRWVPLVQQKLLTLPLSEHMSSLSLLQSCLWTVTRYVPLVQQTLLTFITAHEFTQPCSILSLNSDTMCAPSTAETSYLYHSTWVQFTQPCSILSLDSDTMGAPSAAETSYLYHSTWVHPALFNLVFEQWHDMCP
jgi:hypothetical protein